MRRYLALALASVLAAISVGALAMGLGEIRLNSYLNQRLDAEIELVSAAADELESLEIRLADRSAFERYGLEREAFLNNLEFRVIRRPNGTAYVKVTSNEPVREPFLTFLVEADWSRGRLLREYTLLLDPPTFAGREETAESQPQAPAVTPESQRVERETPIETPRPQPAQPRVEEQQTGDVISIPPLEAETTDEVPPQRAESTFPRQTDESYGPIQRNENLWSIANRVRPDSSITVNQMMIALYRANPEAFQGNINRLKQGYILRIPQFDEVRSISRGEAFSEAKRHNDEWRSGVRPASQPATQAPEPAEPAEAEPELSLVAPEEDLAPETGTGVGAGGETEDLGMGSDEPVDAAEDVEQDAVDLGVEGDTEERLLELEDESLQALQEQEEQSAQAPPLPEAPVAEEPVAEEPVAEEPTGEAAVAEETQAPAIEDQPARSAPIVPVRRAEPTLLDRLTDTLGLGIGAAILVLLLIAFLVVRKRRESSRTKAAAAMADWDDSEDSDVTVVAGRGQEDATEVTDGRDADLGGVFSHGMEHEDTGTTRIEDDAEATQLLSDSDKTQLIDSETAKRDDFSETVVGGQQAVTLDDNDPLSEADFHMAYGLYDQAAEVVQKAVERDPSRKEFHAKLAEIHFAANNTSGFLDAAKGLREVAGPGDPDWDNVAIMGRQIAPDSDLFAEGGSTSSVDLDFGSADDEFSGEETVVKPEADPEPAGGDLDFDIDLDNDKAVGGNDVKPEPADAAGTESDLDFDLDIGGLGEAEPAEPMSEEPSVEQDASAEAGDYDFDIGSVDEGEPAPVTGSNTASADDVSDDETQTEFDKALQELSAFVDTNLPEQGAGDAVENDGELNLDEYSFDEAIGESDDSDLDSGIGEDEDDIGEAGTKLDLARAYIDMGDPDGARGILEEVLSDGDDEQQQEARALLDQLA